MRKKKRKRRKKSLNSKELAETTFQILMQMISMKRKRSCVKNSHLTKRESIWMNLSQALPVLFRAPRQS